VTASMVRGHAVHIASAKAEIEKLVAGGTAIELVMDGAQPYAWVRAVAAPKPPWDREAYDILIAIPIAYDLGTGLDGFYISLPYSFSGGEHNRVNGQALAFKDRQWRAVSWHYPDGKAFQAGVDTIESHIVHCRGFFLARGAVNARV
jgi:Prokaryotic E2 family E